MTGSWLGIDALPMLLGGGDPAVVMDAVYPPGSWDQVLAQQGMPLARVTRLVGGVAQDDGMAVVSGSVTVRDSDDSCIEADMQLTLPKDWTSAQVESMLDPLAGCELLVEAGVEDARLSDDPRWWALGIIVPDAADIEETPESLRVTVRGGDRSWHVRGKPIFEGLAILAPKAVEQVVTDLITPALPGWIGFTPWATGATIPAPRLIGKAGDDRWRAIRDAAQAAGCELRFDRSGVPVLTYLTDVASTQPAGIWYASRGELDSLKRSVSRNEAADGCVVSWGSGKTSFVPDKTRRRYCRYSGDASLVTTEAQAQVAGAGEIVRRGRGASRISGATMSRPLQLGDVVVVASERSSIYGMARLASLSYTLGSSSMSFEVAEAIIPEVA